jgi:hypothetical protein
LKKPIITSGVIYEMVGKIRKKLAVELCHKAGVALGPCGLDEARIFQDNLQKAINSL